ncbi:hypothetical protein [Rhizobium mesosinicum]|uniref:Uncharacterized protein n=1 Tax=Rhizobium mesosinicum TaxID=335017 RepID=A0ABS7H2I3_9HYPH|nr:hypothetical protein [Rhizobium mesosinicum]MBW9056384.1 hypothetical protein [Rhizobium mesosinicum]
MKKPDDDPIQANRPTAEQQQKSLTGGRIIVVLIATVAAIAFLLYITILIYGLLHRA